MKENSNINGVIVVNKETGITSRSVVNEVSKILGTKKVGHTGTLDPLAEGVLVLTIGKCTRLSEFLMSKYKSYTVEFILGYETDTLDITGTKTFSSAISVSEEDISNTILSFVGSYLQEVPIYSAVKVNGKKLYEYARNNEEITLPKRTVEIADISNIEISKDSVKFTCSVSKGTYVRSLVRDIGRKLLTYATMKSLTRVSQGDFFIEDSYTLDEIENGQYKILGYDEIFKDVYTIEADDIMYKDVSNGVLQYLDINSDYVVFKYNSEYVALYKKDTEKKFRMYVKF